MGACSSKPKTTEFEGSTEPSKKTEDVGADRSIDAVDTAQVSKQIEPGKDEEGVVDAGTQAVQETHELIASKNEGPLIKELQSIAEGVSHSVKVESSTVDRESGDSAAEKVETDVLAMRNFDVGDDAADYKEVSDKATTVDDGVGGYPDKLFEDKAVVLDEASHSVVGKGDAYIDKAVAADEEKAHESSDKGSISVLVEESRNLQDINEAPGVESPIIGVVQFSEPIHVDDALESVSSATPETTVHVGSKDNKSLDEMERDILTGPNIGEDDIPPKVEVANLLSGSPQEAAEEKEEVLHGDSKDEIKGDILTGPNIGEDSILPTVEVANRPSGSPQEAPEEKQDVLHDGSNKDEIERDILTGANIGEDGIPPMEDVANLSSGSPQEAAEEKEEVLPEESKDEIRRDILTGPSMEGDGISQTEELANLSLGLPQEATEEKEEVPQDDSKASPLLVSVSDDGLGQGSGADDARGEEAPLASPHAVEETSIEEAIKLESIKVPQNDIQESISEPEEESSLCKCTSESHVEVTENEGNTGILDEPEPEAAKVHEGIDAEISIEPKSETTLEQAIEERGEGIVDEPIVGDVQPQALPIEETAVDGKCEATPDEVIAEQIVETDREEKVEKPHIEEATTNEVKVERGDAGKLDSSVKIAEPSAEIDRQENVEKPYIEEATTNGLKVESGDAGSLKSLVEQAMKASGEPAEQAVKASGEGDLVFEDASDVPLKVESSTTESGDKPNS